MKQINLSKRRWLILPIETKTRELHGKFLLACFAAERGWGVIIGGKKATRGSQEYLPNGTFMEKSIPPMESSKSILDNIESHDNRISTWDEEGLVYMNRDFYFHRRISPESFARVDNFFTWGRQQAEDIQYFIEGAQNKITNSGNPRFDLLRPEFRGIFEPAAERIKKQYGNIILINTSLWLFNHAQINIEYRILNSKKEGMIKTLEQEDSWRRKERLQEKVFKNMLALLPKLSKSFPAHTIILRPHPSEDDTPWLEKIKDLPNVELMHKGSANEWMTAADVVIENNCTTSIEAFLLDRAAITYRPVKDEDVEDKLPNGLGFHADNEDELILLINKIINKEIKRPADYAEQFEFAKRHIANIDGRLASEIIMDTMDKVDLPVDEGRFPIKHRDSFKRCLRKIKRFFWKNTAERYYQKKFPGIKLHEIKQILNEFQRVSGRFKDLKVAKIDDDGFCLYKL